MFQTMRRVRGEAQRFELPVLMVLSRDDKIVDAKKAQKFLDACSSTDKQMRFAEHAKHVITIDTGWEETSGWVSQFVRERSAIAPGG
jgi:esterase/lipase